MTRLTKIVLFVGLLTAVAVGAEPPSKAPRLSEVARFPKEYEVALRAVTAAVVKEGMEPKEYFAEISREGSALHFWLIHESHDPDPGWRGDSCHRCRTIDYDLRSGVVSKISGIR